MTMIRAKSYFEASARERIAGILDGGAFQEFMPPTEKKMSPHLTLFNVPRSFDDGVVVGSGRLGGKSVCIVAQEGHFLGGALGEVNGAKISGLCRRAIACRSDALIFLLDSGGVRLQEANAGEIAASEIIRAILETRLAGIPVIGAVGGTCGAFGGAGIISACCSDLVISQKSRIGVSGPEVIETTMGIEAFDSRNRALVWRTCGGYNRYLLGIARFLADDSIADFKNRICEAMESPSSLALESLKTENLALKQRLASFGTASDANQIWKKMGVSEAENISEQDIQAIIAIREKIAGDCAPPQDNIATHCSASSSDLSSAPKLKNMLDEIFPSGHKVELSGKIVRGQGILKNCTAQIIGTFDSASIGLEELVALSDAFMEVAARDDKSPIVIFVDNSGQRMALREELLGLSQYIGHCIKAQELARSRGHKLIAVVYGNSIAGGFLACGLEADRVCAVPGAETSVMNLRAISAVTKISLIALEELAKTVPVFAPGCQNFHKMGGLHEIWEKDFAANLERAIAEADSRDMRSILGLQRGGRLLSDSVMNEIVSFGTAHSK